MGRRGLRRLAPCLGVSLAGALGAASLGAVETTSALPSFGAPLAVSDEMRRWSEVHLAGLDGAGARVRALAAALGDGGALAIAGASGPTPTAVEAFAARRADCVGFALLFVALAREGGVDARFALSPAIEQIDGDGTLRVRHAHLAVTWGGWLYDLGGTSRLDPSRQRPVGDRTALALFFSNHGADALAHERPRESLALLYEALRLDPSLGVLWSNLGVALRRAGDASGAVLAHEMALRLDPADRAARHNLAIARARQ